MRPVVLASLWMCLAIPVQAAPLEPGDILVTALGTDGHPAAVVRIDPRTGAQTALSTAGLLTDPMGVAVEAAGTLLISDPSAFEGQRGGTAAILRVDPRSGTQTVVSRGGLLATPTALLVTPTGEVVVADPNAFDGCGAILGIDPHAGTQHTLAFGGRLTEPSGLAWGERGTLLVADPFALGDRGAVVQIDPRTGTQTLVHAGGSLLHPIALARGKAGLYAADPSVGQGWVPRVLRLEGDASLQAAGEQQGAGEVLGATMGTLVHPTGVAVEASGTLIVTDRLVGGQGAVWRVDPTSGAQKVLASGGFLSAPCGVVVLATQQVGADADRDGVVDGQDVCAATPVGSVVDARGCSVDPRGHAPDASRGRSWARMSAAATRTRSPAR